MAIDTWLEIQRAFVDPEAPAGAADEQITESLAALYVRTDRWSDLAELLGKAGAREEARLGDRLVRLGDAFRDRLADPRRAVDCYARALQVSPANEAALAGARALLEVPSCRAAAAEALARALEARGDWAGVLRWRRSGCRPRPTTSPGCACCPRRRRWPSGAWARPRRR